MAHSHTVRLPLGALLIPCAVCGAGATGYSPLLARHDDFWISAYLQMQHNATVHRVRVRAPGSARDLLVSSATFGLLRRRHNRTRFDQQDTTSLRDTNDSGLVKAACARHFAHLRNCISRPPGYI